MEGFDPDNPQELRKAAINIIEIFLLGDSAAKPPEKAAVNPASPSRPVLINVPIDFELRTLDMEHPYLRDRKFTDETIRHFSLGYCNRGMFKGRIAIPLHDPKGRLVGYAGRITKDEFVSEKCSKYLFPGERKRDGKVLQFRKSLLLCNAYRITGPVDHLFVVEGFPAMWWLWQAEYRNTVALMGSHCSEEQAKLIVDLVKPDGKVWLMPDGNEAGIQCALSALEQIAPYRFVRWIRLSEDEQPTDYPADELAMLFDS
jgi:DNA primase